MRWWSPMPGATARSWAFVTIQNAASSSVRRPPRGTSATPLAGRAQDVSAGHEKEATVEYRQVGNTELRVSEIGFGCGGNAGLMVRGSPEEQRRVVERAVELGINYFDNAPDYGNGVAEENLGRVLKEVKVRAVRTAKGEIRPAERGE